MADEKDAKQETKKPIFTEEVRDAEGNLISKTSDSRAMPEVAVSFVDPGNGRHLDRRGLWGSIAAQQVLSDGGDMKQALDACVKARMGTADDPGVPEDVPAQATDPEMIDFVKYIHATARLHSGRFEDLTVQGMLEVAMLCPYPIVDFETWRQKMSSSTGREE